MVEKPLTPVTAQNVLRITRILSLLSIIDLTTGVQPIACEDRRTRILMNGEFSVTMLSRVPQLDHTSPPRPTAADWSPCKLRGWRRARVGEVSAIGKLLPCRELLDYLLYAPLRSPHGACSEEKMHRWIGSFDGVQYGSSAAIWVTPFLTSQLRNSSTSLARGAVVVVDFLRRVADEAFIEKARANSPWLDQRDMDAERREFLAQAQ